MFGGRFSLRGRSANDGDQALLTDLKRATDSNVIEVPPALMGSVIEASQKGEDERRTIMKHLRECLAEPSGKRWRRIYAGLLLTEELLRAGSPDLLLETAEGRHFDLVQRLSLLEVFECTNDKRVQNMVRTKASALRAEVVPCLETASEGSSAGARDHPPAERKHAEGGSAPAAETPKGALDSYPSGGAPLTSISSFSTSASTFGGSDNFCTQPSYRPEGTMVLNGVVTVGHRDDTSSESSGNEDSGVRAAVAYRQHSRKSTRERDQRRRQVSSGDESGSSKQSSVVPQPPPPPVAPTVDLLNL